MIPLSFDKLCGSRGIRATNFLPGLPSATSQSSPPYAPECELVYALGFSHPNFRDETGYCHEKFGPPKNGPPGPYISKYLDPPELIFQRKC